MDQCLFFAQGHTHRTKTHTKRMHSNRYKTNAAMGMAAALSLLRPMPHVTCYMYTLHRVVHRPCAWHVPLPPLPPSPFHMPCEMQMHLASRSRWSPSAIPQIRQVSCTSFISFHLEPCVWCTFFEGLGVVVHDSTPSLGI